MPLLLIIAGLILVVSAYENTEIALFQQLSSDVPGFTKWAAAIVAVGALGYVPAFRTPARALLALVIIVIFLTNYQTILAAVSNTTVPATPAPAALEPKPLSDPIPVQVIGSSSSSSNPISGLIGSAAKAVTGGAGATK